MTEEQPPDLELVDRARDGDDWAFRTLVDRYESQVAATVVGMLGPGPDAEDVGQETFIRFYHALDRFRGESALGTYLTRIAISLSVNACKRRQRSRLRSWSRGQVQDAPPKPFMDGRADAEQALRNDRVRHAVDRLTPDHRAVVVLRMLTGYSSRETAELLGIPESTVLSRLSRAMSQLKELLEPAVKNDE